MKLCIIPARGGSKRIPGKNIKRFVDKPIIHYSIEAAKRSEIFDRVIVSTDSEEIADVAKAVGAEIPFFRPKELADDYAGTGEVLGHAVQWFMDRGETVEYFCCLYATAPFAQPEYIRKGYDIITKEGVSSVFSVTSFAYPVFRALGINSAGYLEMFWPEYEFTRSNDLPEGYHDAGQFYWLDTKQFLKTGKIFTKDAKPVILPRYLVQDIDTIEDWETAEKMFTSLKGNVKQNIWRIYEEG